VSRPCLFLDRDGVINVAPPRGQYITNWSSFELIPSIVDWIRLFKALDFLIVVITNQRCVSLGLLSQSQLDAIHSQMLDLLASRGALIDGVLACPHAENACQCRKPKPGLVLAAQLKWDIDLSRSLFIGDSQRDQDLAALLDISFIRVREGTILNVLPRGSQSQQLQGLAQ
jgi:D-glycero-D-manno-heptose 1,7-bisphosphate phosphatase